MRLDDIAATLRDKPLRFKAILWPDVVFYKEQRLLIESVWENKETYAPWGNKLGKDFTAGFIALTFFLTRNPCRVVTTSAKEDHLRVLWGEINRFVQTSRVPLRDKEGGPLVLNHQDFHKVYVSGPQQGKRCPISYLKGMVAGPDSIAAMQGHHVAKTGDGVPRTLFMSDESSSVANEYYRMARTWFNRALIFGNTWPCDNFFRKGVDAGDLVTEEA